MKLFKKLLFPFQKTVLMLVVLASLVTGALSACRSTTSTFTPAPQATKSQLPTPQPEPTSSPTATPSPPYQAWVDPALPETLHQILALDPDLKIVSSKSSAQFLISPNSGSAIGYWTYLLVVPFYSSLDNIASDTLELIWTGKDNPSPEINQILVNQDAHGHISSAWGASDPANVFQVSNDQITDLLWHNPGTAAIIPFEDLTASLKVVKVDQQHPFQLEEFPSAYPLSLPIYYQNTDFDLAENRQLILNFNPDLLTSVALTGVTALVRDTAVIMEEQGIYYPAEDILEILRTADITHINNEVPFDEDCPPPTSDQDSLSFCSSDDYIKLLDYIGADVIELSGDHFSDKGAEAVFHTIELYQQKDYQIYGGGLNLQKGLEPIFLEHNGNKFAFIGCNAKAEGFYAGATENNPGAAECNFEWMTDEITNLVADGKIVIATMQHEEVDSFFPIALQIQDFQQLAQAGASVVSGSQAHHPQGFEITDKAFIHYGLGNLFFDQWYLATHNPEIHKNKDKGTIDIHYFYDNQYISTILIPIQFIDNARPRPMSLEESQDFFYDLFYASKWNERWVYLYPAGYFEPLVIP